MSNKDILKTAIQKALDNGWDAVYVGKDSHWVVIADPLDTELPLVVTDAMGTDVLRHPFQVIFDQEFAKALWGGDEWTTCKVCNREHYDETDQNEHMRADHYHLKEMVTADDPLKYLADNI